MIRLNQIIFRAAVDAPQKPKPMQSEVIARGKRVAASTIESKFKILVPGGRNHEKISKAVEDFLEKNPPKK